MYDRPSCPVCGAALVDDGPDWACVNRCEERIDDLCCARCGGSMRDYGIEPDIGYFGDVANRAEVVFGGESPIVLGG